ncbi:MAG: hypothetical protein MJ247_06675 [Alphaproteobacteria bacterium]|nr:hypothetical protein [Alphaproteobacteria bacterium]
MAEIVYYNVVLFAQDKWTVVANYSEEKRSAAIEEAKRLDNYNSAVVESYSDAETGDVLETNVIYASSDERPKVIERNVDYEAFKKKQAYFFNFSKFVLSILLSVLISIFVTLFASQKLIQKGIITVDTMEKYSTLIFVLSIVLIGALLNLIIFREKFFGKKNKQKLAPDTIIFKKIAKAIKVIKPSEKKNDDFLFSQDATNQKFDDKGNRVFQIDVEEKVTLRQEKTESSLPQESIEKLKNHNNQLKLFLSIILKIIQKQKYQLSYHSSFGIKMMLLGATDSIGLYSKLTKEEKNYLLDDTLMLLKENSKSLAEFHKKIDEFLLNPKYMKLYEVGSKAYEQFNTSQDAGKLEDAVQLTLKNWFAPTLKAATESDENVTIVFTDISNATNISADPEQAKASLQYHNETMRKRIKESSGKEIKMTGYGFMVSFAKEADALTFATKAMRDINSYNSGHQESQMLVRMGVNSGKVIIEENDLFGLNVQIAARAYQAAEPKQILATDAVKKAVGSKFGFQTAGKFRLKGVDGDVRLHSVDY